VAEDSFNIAQADWSIFHYTCRRTVRQFSQIRGSYPKTNAFCLNPVTNFHGHHQSDLYLLPAHFLYNSFGKLALSGFTTKVNQWNRMLVCLYSVLLWLDEYLVPYIDFRFCGLPSIKLVLLSNLLFEGRWKKVQLGRDVASRSVLL